MIAEADFELKPRYVDVSEPFLRHLGYLPAPGTLPRIPGMTDADKAHLIVRVDDDTDRLVLFRKNVYMHKDWLELAKKSGFVTADKMVPQPNSGGRLSDVQTHDSFDQTLPVPAPPIPTMFAIDPEILAKEFKRLKDSIGSLMVEGIDFGTIPGTKGRTLYKPGAEKLSLLFGLEVHTERIQVVQEKDYLRAEFKTTIFDRTGRLIAEAEGICTSREKRYRVQMEKGKDIDDLYHTIIRIASKRSFVAAVRQATGASAFFEELEKESD